MSKQRKSRAGAIAQVAQSNTDTAMQMAFHGCEKPSVIKQIVSDYLYAKEHNPTQRETPAGAFCELLIDTLLRRDDKKKRRDIMSAMKNYRECDHLRFAMVLLKQVQTPPPSPGKGWKLISHKPPTLSVKKITAMAFPRHKFPRLSDESYTAMLASHEKTASRLVKQMGIQLSDK
jgi:hypothetical protein